MLVLWRGSRWPSVCIRVCFGMLVLIDVFISICILHHHVKLQRSSKRHAKLQEMTFLPQGKHVGY